MNGVCRAVRRLAAGNSDLRVVETGQYAEMAEEMTRTTMSVVSPRLVVPGRRRGLPVIMEIRIALCCFIVRRIACNGLPAEAGRKLSHEQQRKHRSRN